MPSTSDKIALTVQVANDSLADIKLVKRSYNQLLLPLGRMDLLSDK